MSKKKLIIIISIIVGALVIAGLYGTFATDEASTTSENTYNITLTGNSNEIVVPAGSSKTVIYQVTNTNKGKVNYGITFGGENIEVKVYEDSMNKESDLIDYGESKFIKLLITNTGTTESTASVNVVLGYEKDTNLNQPNLVPSGHTFVTESYTKPSGGGSGGSSNTLVNLISNLYNNATKTEVDAADGITYNYATEVSLMNDRLGTMNTGINDGNIRYYGASPDNYIDIGDKYEGDDEVIKPWVEAGVFSSFGFYEEEIPTNSSECFEKIQCSYLVENHYAFDDFMCEMDKESIFYTNGFTSDDDVCTTISISAGTPILYRIIGLFKDVELVDGSRKDLIKVMRDEPIGEYSWDQSASTVNSGMGVNEWSQADLMKLLNPGYEEETVGGSLYWNSGSGSCYGYDKATGSLTSVPCDFTTNGLSTSAQNNIEAVKWNLGGWNNRSVFANQMYSYERQGNVVQNPSDGIQRKTVWEGRVALAYPSDYGYAVDLGSCSSKLDDYDNYIGTNWMYDQSLWLLTPSSSDANYAWQVNLNGVVGTDGIVHDDLGVSPVFYLDSELTVESGTGKSDDPYVLW